MANPNPSPKNQFTEGNTVGVQFQPGHEVTVTHGVDSVRATGEIPAKLATAALLTREQEIVANLATLEGIEREMENASRVGMLCLALGEAWLQKELAKGKGFADIGLLGRLRTYISGTMRDLEKLATMKEKVGKGRDALVYDDLVKELQR
jgi:hypothetical protein